MSRIGAVIGNHGGEAFLAECVRTLRAQTRAPDEVLVVDGGSADRSREVAERAGARVVTTENRGLSHLYNLGVTLLPDADLVLLANADVSFDTRCIELLADALEADDARFAADPTQLAWDGSSVVHARSTLRRGPLVRQVLPGFRLDELVPSDAVVPTLHAGGAAMLVRRDRFRALGGFDETFFLEFEELDLCWRARMRGWETVYVPGARVRHHVGGVTSTHVRARRLRSAHHNRLRFALKCLPARAAGRVVLGELLALPRHPLLCAPALFRVVLELREILRLRNELAPSAAALERALALARDGQTRRPAAT